MIEQLGGICGGGIVGAYVGDSVWFSVVQWIDGWVGCWRD